MISYLGSSDDEGFLYAQAGDDESESHFEDSQTGAHFKFDELFSKLKTLKQDREGLSSNGVSFREEHSQCVTDS